MIFLIIIAVVGVGATRIAIDEMDEDEGEMLLFGMDENEARDMAEDKFESSPKPPLMVVRITDSGSETYHIPTKEEAEKLGISWRPIDEATLLLNAQTKEKALSNNSFEAFTQSFQPIGNLFQAAPQSSSRGPSLVSAMSAEDAENAALSVEPLDGSGGGQVAVQNKNDFLDVFKTMLCLRDNTAPPLSSGAAEEGGPETGGPSKPGAQSETLTEKPRWAVWSNEGPLKILTPNPPNDDSTMVSLNTSEVISANSDEADKAAFFMEKRLAQKDTEEKVCLLCCDKPSNAVFVSCGHSEVCYDCALDTFIRSNASCPFCRALVQQVVTVNSKRKLHNESGLVTAKVTGPHKSFLTTLGLRL
mmetsp:Transcript_3883/g.5132  ORF Transcript_3883/g.5132 Transcript_3883/m.5132 type:complete len:360 (+) Transcript_3883:72-1151(+)|eukprot:CAMPEP_0114352704 /NCGR_PEP_ID=MMETSP0101-20121206/18133_1 /TAXON_ID=38822 ORGANISM="Pteridomonas danica, Strain PT" /NCGR_SAMPLE_ID=MMETSP0101 /ASSEMBLY_ACC=CAM_ASM_000211 /LENGTH=359 /DNA_ID=CAMNT_0001493213 /DNA_START=46 /DNA_END=1125 /DNA_ORIENTATION=-